MKLLLTIFFLLITLSSFSQKVLNNSLFFDNWILVQSVDKDLIETKLNDYLKNKDYGIPKIIDIKKRILKCYPNSEFIEVLGTYEEVERLYPILKINEELYFVEDIDVIHNINKSIKPSLYSDDSIYEYLTLFINSLNSDGERWVLIQNKKHLNNLIIDKSLVEDINISKPQIINNKNGQIEVMGHLKILDKISFAHLRISKDGKMEMLDDQIIKDRLEFFTESITQGGYSINMNPNSEVNKKNWVKRYVFYPKKNPYSPTNSWSIRYPERTKTGGVIVMVFLNGSVSEKLNDGTTYGQILNKYYLIIKEVSNEYRMPSEFDIVMAKDPEGNILYQDAYNDEFLRSINQDLNSEESLLFYQIYYGGKLQRSLAIDKNKIDIEDKIKTIYNTYYYDLLLATYITDLNDQLEEIDKKIEAGNKLKQLYKNGKLDYLKN